MPTGPHSVVLLGGSREREHRGGGGGGGGMQPNAAPILLNLTSDMLGLDSAWLLQGVQGRPLFLSRYDNIWHLLSAALPARHDIALGDMVRYDELWSSPNLHPGAVWTISGRPSQVKVFRSDGQPFLVSSLLVNAMVACILLQHLNGKTVLRCGHSSELFPGAASAW